MVIDRLWNLWINHWQDLGLIGVGLSAVVIYILQERLKRIEAASLIVLQIDSLQNRLRELSTYIVDGKLNSVAFYEALPLIKENYWDKYKHYFVRKMSTKDFSNINKLYDYVSIVQEQQVLLQNLQKNDFVIRQNLVMSSEMQFITAILQNIGGKDNPKQKEMIDALTKTIPANLLNTDRSILEQVLEKVIPQDMDFNVQTYMNYREKLEEFINRSPFTPYIPEQIAQSLQKVLREYSMLTVDGTEGYKMLEKQAKRRF